MEDDKVGCKLAIVGRVIVALHQLAEEAFHLGEGGLQFLRIAALALSIKLLLRISRSFLVGCLRVLNEELTHMIDYGRNPLPIEVVPPADFLETLEGLHEGVEDFVGLSVVRPGAL